MKFKKNMIKLLTYLLVLLSLLTTGCYTTYYYLQDTQIYASLPDDNKIIYKDRNDGDISISLNFDYSREAAFSGNNGMHSVVGMDGSVIIDTSYDTTWGSMGYTIDKRYTIIGDDFRGYNEFVSYPEISTGLEIEINLSKYVFLAASLHYARNNNYNNFRYSLGVGGGYSNENIGICGCFRTGFQSYYCATNLLYGRLDQGYHTTETATYNMGFYTGMSYGINSIKELLFLNYYLNLSMNIFEYVDIRYSDDFKYDAILENIIITPGIFKDIGNSRITAGFTYLFVTTILNDHLKETSERLFPKVFLQYSYRFKRK